jgi:hypothetical protein
MERASNNTNQHTVSRNLVGEEVGNVSELVVNHEGQHTHLGGTALVELDGALLELGFLCTSQKHCVLEKKYKKVQYIRIVRVRWSALLTIEAVPAKVQSSVAEVTNEFSSGDVLHDGKFQETNEKKDLEGTGNRDGERGIPSVSKVRELGAIIGNVSGKVDSGGVDEVSDNSQHADTSVLDLNVSETVELFLVTIGNKSKRVEESKRSLGTELAFEGSQRGGGGGLLGRSEGSGLIGRKNRKQ